MRSVHVGVSLQIKINDAFNDGNSLTFTVFTVLQAKVL